MNEIIYMIFSMVSNNESNQNWTVLPIYNCGNFFLIHDKCEQTKAKQEEYKPKEGEKHMKLIHRRTNVLEKNIYGVVNVLHQSKLNEINPHSWCMWILNSIGVIKDVLDNIYQNHSMQMHTFAIISINIDGVVLWSQYIGNNIFRDKTNMTNHLFWFSKFYSNLFESILLLFFFWR